MIFGIGFSIGPLNLSKMALFDVPMPPYYQLSGTHFHHSTKFLAGALIGDQQMRVGLWFYGLATALTGILNIVWGEFEASHQPIKSLGQNPPGQHILAYIVSAWLLAAGLAILWQRTAKIGAAGSAMIYCIFALLWLPRFYTVPHALGFRMDILIFVLFGAAQQLLLAAPAAIIYVANASPDPVQKERASVAVRWILGLSPITFGLGHLMNVHAIARFVPHWVPFANFWTVLTGIAFLLAGVAIVTGVRDLLAARLLVLMLLLFEGIVEIPPVFMHPHSQVAWGGALYNLTAIGGYWIFIQFVASRRASRNEVGAPEYTVASRPGSAVA
jgi:uncharacterized membrane protein YphA (DoxX/SURF4 family)